MAVPDLSRVAWRKSSRSGGNGGACVEVGPTGRAVAVRDSKDPQGPRLIVASAGWRAFVHGVKRDAFSQP
ncbi:MAG: DUF397 domain-containing protein [Streptosporangiaceae bacterium]